MGSKSGKQQAQTGTSSYWPNSDLFNGFAGGYGSCLSPFGFGGLNSSYNWFNGISPLASYPGFGFGQQSITTGAIKLKHTLTGATLNYKW